MFLLHSSWTRIKVLYVVTRYVPFLLFAMHLYLNFIPDETPNTCQFVNNFCSCFSSISGICSEMFFILRTYALWENNKVILAVMLTTFAGVIVGSMVSLFSATAAAPFKTSPIPDITGCYQSSGSTMLFVPFLLLLVLELMLISLTLVCAIRNWRSNPSPLYAVLLKHNVFYYVCGLFFSSVNVLTSLLLNYAYSGMFEEYVSHQSLRERNLLQPLFNCVASNSSFSLYSLLECTFICGTMTTDFVLVPSLQYVSQTCDLQATILIAPSSSELPVCAKSNTRVILATGLWTLANYYTQNALRLDSGSLARFRILIVIENFKFAARRPVEFQVQVVADFERGEFAECGLCT
ncbi:hypothetical protein M405DRAFT_883532 [Rhizopogon salebrosus TDB-379]|nr:hypothetical protein M405DRAFT_883532 [Rhizopogon salebrosus TDB-379]